MHGPQNIKFYIGFTQYLLPNPYSDLSVNLTLYIFRTVGTYTEG